MDSDGDGYVRSATLVWDADVSGSSGSLTVFAKTYWRITGTTTWNSFYTTPNYVITGSSSTDTSSIGVISGGHNLYDWRIEIYEAGNTAFDDYSDPLRDSDLGSVKMETAVEDGAQPTATIYDAWWTNVVDLDHDLYARTERLNWDADVVGSSGTLSVFAKVYWKLSTATTWNSFITTANYTITGSSTADVNYVDVLSGSHNLYDWRIEIYRVGQTAFDNFRDSTNDPDLFHVKMETVAEDAVAGGKPGDINHDGKSDLVWRNYSTGENAAWMMNSTGVPSSAVSYPGLTDLNWHMAGVADFNADGNLDLVWRNTATGQNAIWYLSGGSVIGAGLLPPVADPSWVMAGVMDFNGDGFPDVLWRNLSTGQDAIWLMSGVSVSSVLSLPGTTDMNWRIDACGDLNGDGIPDILWRNYSTGANAVWVLSGGGAVTNVISLPGVGDLNFHVVAIGEYSGDSVNDLVWRNFGSGTDAIWVLSTTGTSISVPGTMVLPLIPTSWQVAGPR